MTATFIICLSAVDLSVIKMVVLEYLEASLFIIWFVFTGKNSILSQSGD